MCALHKRFPSEYKPIAGQINAEEYIAASHVDITNTVDQITYKRMKELFVYMDEKKSSEVRVAFLSSFSRILRHIQIPNEELFKLLEKILSYTRDNDIAIRAAIPEGTGHYTLHY